MKNPSLCLGLVSLLAMAGCDSTNPVLSPGPTNPNETPSDEVGTFFANLRQFHNARSSDEAYLNSSIDSVLLIPSEVAVPAGLTLEWWHTDDGVVHPIDSSKPTRVLLQDGIVIASVDRRYHVQHLAVGSFEAPLIGPASGAMDFFVDSILIASSKPGVVIHYTLDGSYPTTSSPIFDGKIPLDHPYLVRTIGVLAGKETSLARSASYSMAQGWNPAIAYDTLRDTRDGQSYPTLRLGNQTWMAKNLNWSVPGGSLRDSREGAVYTFDQVKEGNLCPEGWSVPSRADWDSLVAWGTRQQGVTPANFGNALRSTALLDGRMSNGSENHVDLFGFRATSANFWMRTPAADSTMVMVRSFSAGSLVESTQLATTTRWLYDGQESHSGQVPTTSRVRCLKDAP